MSTKKPAPLEPTNKFCVSFDTKWDKKHGYIKAVQVTLEEIIMDIDDSVRVDLADHPLYLKLQQYVLANPR